MRKFLTLIMAVLLLVTCVGCSSGDNNTDETQGSSTPDVPSQTQDTEPDNTEDTSKPEDEIKLDGVAYVGGRSITINYDDSRRKDTKSDSLVFHSQTSNAIVLTYDKSSSYTGAVDGVFELLNDGDLFSDISTYTGTAFGGDATFKISVVSSEKVVVAGFDSVKIIGTVTDANGKAAAVYAYTFVIDETPCMLAGIIIDDANNTDVADAVREEVDLMAKTIKEA